MINKLKTVRLASASEFLNADSGIEAVRPWFDGVRWWLVVAGQTGGWSERERVWVHDRLPGGPHGHKVYSGYWAYSSVPQAIYATGIQVVGALTEATAEGLPLLRLPTGSLAAQVQWDSTSRDMGTASGDAALKWDLELCEAATGALLYSLAGSPSRQGALPALQAGGSYVLRINVSGQHVGTYQWPPPDYLQKSGEVSPVPARYSWEHPTLGTLYYDPRYRVGARPYDRGQEDQAELLAQERDPVPATKIPEWANYLVEFDADGARITLDGEYSLLRIVAGDATEWIEAAVDTSCYTPALWRAPWNPFTRSVEGEFEVWKLDCGLRSVGYLAQDEDGSLLIGGATSGPSGPLPCLYQVQPQDDSAGDAAHGSRTVSLFFCECVMALGKALRGIVRTTRGLMALSPCDRFAHRPSAPPLLRLEPSHPGGRNLLRWINSLGENKIFSTEAGDFATDKDHPKAHGFILAEFNGQLRTGAPLGKQLDSQLAVYGAEVYGVWDEDPAKVTALQHLCSSPSGLLWSPQVDWNKGVFDGGVCFAVGSRARGLALWCTGTKGDSSFAPRALRLQGTQVTRHVDCDHFIQRLDSVEIDGETVGFGTGLRWNSGSGYSRDQELLLIQGEDPELSRACAFWNFGSSSFRFTLDSFQKIGARVEQLAVYYGWNGVAWQPSGVQPSEPYLQVNVGAVLISFQLHGTLPYSPELFELLCFELDGNGSLIGPSPDTLDENALDVLDHMPVGTRVMSVRLEVDADSLEGNISAVALKALLVKSGTPDYVYESIYPAFWLRVDGAEPLQLNGVGALTDAQRATLAEFNCRIGIGEDRYLPVQSQLRVEALCLVAPGWTVLGAELKRRF